MNDIYRDDRTCSVSTAQSNRQHQREENGSLAKPAHTPLMAVAEALLGELAD